MQVRHREVFTSIQTEGAILPPDLLKRIFSGDSDLDGLKSKDYHLSEGEKLNEAINRSWNVLQGYWRSFLTGKEKLAKGDLGTTLTRERWLLPLFQELGYGRLLTHKAIEIENKTYPISHSWHKAPIHLVGCKVDLDRRMAKVAGAAQRSPHSLVQELLNRSDDYLWAFLSNGARLRILRDNLSLTRQAYVEFDLATMMEGEIYSDFVLLWLLCHQSRVEADKPEEFWLEKWSRTAQEQGTRALDQLRNGVEDAIKALGSGFLKHPLNWALREKLKAGQLDKQDYYRQILRLIYRLLFLFVAEDRDMLFDPDSRTEAREFYIEYYSTTRLRRIAEKFRGTRHSDLYQGFRLVSEKLGDHDCPELGLPALGSFLFSKNKALPDLENSEISNEDFLNAIRALAYTLDQGKLRAVDYKNLGSEEFGSVYESLLEQHPNLNADAGTFELKVAGGHERKTTGSYYTPSSLVQCLLDSALNSVLDEAARKPDPEKAILDLKICDPASGSGHFLIAAAHRVARRLAAIRTGDEEPAPEATQAALRDVISHCIYGVDLNPMAVELCKVALWMEALEPGKPLSFLDHKIQCGNSLLGTTPKLLADGIPNEAFKPIKGDDPKYCSVLRRRNEQERQGQMTMWASMVAESHAAYGSLSDRYRTLDEMDDASVNAIAEKEKQYDRLLQSADYQHSKLIADAWCAAFVWPKRTDASEPVTQDIFRQVQSLDLQPIGKTVAEVHELSEKYRFFHWHLAFPDVFRVPSDRESAENYQVGWNGGFSVVLGNPPWERIKIQEKEWFAEKSPEIVNAPNAAVRRHLIEELAEENPTLYHNFFEVLRLAEGESSLVRNTGRYPHCGRGDINTYGLFAELNRSLLNRTGRAGFIIQSDIATGETYKEFFSDLLKKNQLVSFYDFVNTEGIFPAVHRTHPHFCLITLSASGISAHVDFSFWNTNTNNLLDHNRHFTLSANDIELLNPNTLTCPIFRSKRDAKLTKEIFSKVPVFIKNRIEEGNPWDIKIRRLFDMNKSEVLKICKRVESDDFPEGHLPMYESKMIFQYDHRFGTYEGQTQAQANQRKLPEVNVEHHLNPLMKVRPRYSLPASEVRKRCKNKWKKEWLLVWRDITSAVSKRTVIAAIIPFVGTDFTLRVAFPTFGPELAGMALLANLNCFCFDYTARQKVGGTHLSDYLMKQLPVLNPDIYEKEIPWLSNEPLYLWIRPRVLELTFTASDLEYFAADCGYIGLPFRWEEKRRILIRSELDAAFFHLYGIEREDLEYIMESFLIVKRKDEEKYGNFRTKEIILGIYDSMAKSILTRHPYQTIINPLPADPLVTHSSKA